MRRFQWISNRYLCTTPEKLFTILKSRRGCKALASLLPLLQSGTEINLTYDELARVMGYRNRSGAYKAMKVLEQLGVVKTTFGYTKLTMGNLTFDD